MLSPFPGFAMVPSAAVSVMLWVPTSWYISGFCMFLHHSRRYTLCRINAIVSPWATVSHREPPWTTVSQGLRDSALRSLLALLNRSESTNEAKLKQNMYIWFSFSFHTIYLSGIALPAYHVYVCILYIYTCRMLHWLRCGCWCAPACLTTEHMQILHTPVLHTYVICIHTHGYAEECIQVHLHPIVRA